MFSFKYIGEWLDIAEKTYQWWNYPSCFGAVDGKHIVIVKPKHSVSDFYYHKSFYSIVLMALVDYDYKFLATDVGLLTLEYKEEYAMEVSSNTLQCIMLWKITHLNPPL